MTQRYLMKGGYWKNSEDEILKAAIIKYGFNQWSRISSLIPRKAAKQCKARWYEWLDPSIKKTEWTRDEEEKLLHLAKIFPSQWRTIAPIVGRTPAQCVEHYERLLDQAQGRDSNPENDPRKLKPGEIDPTPEIRPARADARDMDDDEKEMIAESRVRLANIKGKKAKRRDREKFIERSKQMAQLQKQRELKAAGIDYVIEKKKKRKRVEIDYNAEIPFEARPVDVVYNPGDEENPAAKTDLGNISISQLEGPRRDIEEKKQRKLDIQKLKKLKTNNLPAYIEKVNKKNPFLYQKKGQLVLPEPQLTDKDLELLAKLTKNSIESNPMAGSIATKDLVGNYSIRDPTPLRTPKYSTQILQQARNIFALSESPAPMVGGSTDPRFEAELNESLVSGKKSNSHTPNPYKSMLLKSPRAVLRGDTPLSLLSKGKTPLIKNSLLDDFMSRSRDSATPKLTSQSQTPLIYNDELNLNDNEWADSVWEETGLQEEANPADKLASFREMIKSCVKNLPKPKNEYDFELPQLEEFRAREQALMEKVLVKDQEDERNIFDRIEKQKKFKNLMKRSSSIRMGLPLPSNLGTDLLSKLRSSSVDPSALIEKEMIQMMVNDNVDHHGRESLLGKRSSPSLLEHYTMDFEDEFEIEQLEQAEMLIEDEVQQMMEEQQITTEEVDNLVRNVYLDSFKQDWQKVRRVKKVRRSSGANEAKNSALIEEMDQESNLEIKHDLSSLKEQCKKLEGVISTYSKELENYSLEKQNTEIVVEIRELRKKLKTKRIEEEVYKQLKTQEATSIIIRSLEQQRYLDQLLEKEQALQKAYQHVLNKIQDMELAGDIGDEGQTQEWQQQNFLKKQQPLRAS